MTVGNLATVVSIIPAAADNVPNNDHDELTDVHVQRHIRFDGKYEEGLEGSVVVTCAHDACCTETNVVESNCTTFQHASEGNQEKEYYNYFSKPRRGGGLKESMLDFKYLLAGIICYFRITKTRRLFTFLFLPIKEKINATILFIRELFSLKDVGWGPPGQARKLSTHAPKLVVCVFLNTRSSQFSLRIRLGVFFIYVPSACFPR